MPVGCASWEGLFFAHLNVGSPRLPHNRTGGMIEQGWVLGRIGKVRRKREGKDDMCGGSWLKRIVDQGCDDEKGR